MAKAVIKAVDDGHLEDVDQYDAGGYGYHPAPDGTESYFETGSCWLGNGEEEWQLPTDIPYSEENDYADTVDSRSVYRWFTISGDCIYTTSTMMYVYGVPWQYVEEAGRELGLLGGDNAPAENTEENTDDIPRF
jgi:subtilisin family serine protease